MLEGLKNILPTRANRERELQTAVRSAYLKARRSERRRAQAELKKQAGLAYKQGQRDTMRAYAGGTVNRLNEGWPTGPVSINADIRTYLSAIRERARDLVKNHEHARRFVNLCKSNIVGPFGFKFQSNVEEQVGEERVEDAGANAVIEDRFADWCKPENCDISGRHSFRAMQLLIAGSVPRDGEICVRFIYDKKLKYGFALQLIEPDIVDTLYNEQLPNGNVVQMGVEIDKWRRPVAYWIREPVPAVEAFGVAYILSKRTRVPASEMLLIMDRDFVNQTRGISWMAAGMTAANMLSGYEDSVAVNARFTAAKMFILKNGKTEPGEDVKGDGKTAAGDIVIDAEPGSTWDIKDKDMVQLHEEFPSQQYEMFVNAKLRSIASAWNVSYASLSNDLSQANYGSNRVGMLDEREGWKMMQQWLTEVFLVPVYNAWLRESLLAGALTINGKGLPFSKMDKFNSPNFVGRRWNWIDPLKDILGELAMIEGGLKTATESLAERGYEIEDVFRTLGKEKQLAKKYGLTLSTEVLSVKGTLAGIADSQDQPPPAAGAPAKAPAARESRAKQILQEFRDLLLTEQIHVNGH